MYFEKIKGDRIYLSPTDINDAGEYAKWLNSKDVSTNLGVYSKMYTVKSVEEGLYSSDNYSFSIVLKENNLLIGNVSLKNVDFINRKAELDTFIGEEKYRGDGYGKEAVKLLLNYAFNTLNLNNIMIKVFSFNEMAIRAYKKIGFKTFGVRKRCVYNDGAIYDEVYMEVLKDEFNAIQEFIYLP